jgi:L-aspartate oxidase
LFGHVTEPLDTDYLVIGSGIAGLNFALLAAEHGHVVVCTKKGESDTNTNWAQGGVAAVLAKGDSFEQHVADTLVAGDGLCDREVVELCVNEGPASVERLLALGCRLDRDPAGALDLGREGAHTHHRVVHWEDVTGREIQRAMVAAVAKHGNITVLDEHLAIDLLSTAHYGKEPGCFGAFVLDRRSGEVKTITARATVLASGGTGKVFVYTSNPEVATGDGVAMAYRMGAVCGDLEFVQFHPTVLYHPAARNFLISEALRGEGGVLRLVTGETFMENYHPMKSLASRDIVARAIDNELKKSGADCVLLDMTHLDPAFVRGRFPNIYESCCKLGIDMTKVGIPVVPAAHYMCGGVQTDTHGATTVPGLYAIGEVAFTGLHGANRLASNSLLEGMVYSQRAAAAVRAEPARKPARMQPWSSGDATDSNDAIVVALNWEEIRRFMWAYVSIVRSDKRLERARHRIENVRDEIRQYYLDFKVNTDLIELRNVALVAELIITCARQRKESRGLHYTLDHPSKLAEAKHSRIGLHTGGPRGK